MNFPKQLRGEQIRLYEAIFASGDGERLLAEWEESRAVDGVAEQPMDISALRDAIAGGCFSFASACLRVLPDRFFDLKQPLKCRDRALLMNAMYAEMYARIKRPEDVDPYHDLAERFVRRGWDPLYGKKDEQEPWRSVHPMLQQIAGIHGSTPLLRRLVPLAGGWERVRRFSDRFCNGFTDTTLLHRAVESRDSEIVRFFVTEVGIDPNTVDSQGCTTIMPYLWMFSSTLDVAKREQAREIAHELVALGLDLERRDKAGDTLLFRAVRDDAPGALSVFIELGADRFARDRQGRTLLEMADQEGVGAEAARYLRSLDMGQALSGAMGSEDAADAPRPSTGFTL